MQKKELKRNAQKYFFVLLFPIVLVLPLPLQFGSVSLVFASLNLLFLLKRNEIKTNIHSLFREGLVLLLAAVFLLDIITEFLSKGNLQLIFKEVRITFLFLPAVIYLSKTKLETLRNFVLLLFVSGVLIYIIYADLYLVYFYNFVANVEFKLDHFLKYSFINVPGAYHHTYQGMYMLFSVLVLMDGKVTQHVVSRKMTWFLICVILLHMFFMASKITLLLALAFLFLTYLMSFLRFDGIKRTAVVVCAFLLAILFYVLFKNEVFNTIWFSFSNRVESWKCSIDIFYKNPVYGASEEFIVDNLKKCVTSSAISTHNQFLDELLNYGFFAVWLPIFYVLVFIKSKQDGLLRNLFLGVLVISVFENVLSLQRGVLFVIFFMSFLYFCPIKKENLKNHDQ